MLSLNLRTATQDATSPGLPEVNATRATLDARTLEACMLDGAGAVETLDFRHRPWIPGQGNSRAIADQVVFENLVRSVKRVTDSVMLQMLRQTDQAW